MHVRTLPCGRRFPAGTGNPQREGRVELQLRKERLRAESSCSVDESWLLQCEFFCYLSCAHERRLPPLGKFVPGVRGRVNYNVLGDSLPTVG